MSVSLLKMRRTTSVLGRLDQRPFWWRSPPSAPHVLRAPLDAEDGLCRGFFRGAVHRAIESQKVV